jgi:A/G-specific adenine glycosylase
VRLLRKALLGWYEMARRDLPWRKTRDPYAIWLSEVMLQQTRVETVVPYYDRFLAHFPTVQALAEAPLDGVLTMWSGLGYYRRARMLHEAAREVANGRGGRFPATAEALASIRGIGRYTAGAIASMAFGQRAALVDGNVARVLARLFAVEDDVRSSTGQRQIWDLADALVPNEDAGTWNQALMELGATICVPRAPRCLVCPVRAQCDGRARGLEQELPRVKPKRKPLLMRRVALVATHKGTIVLGRRRVESLFGGMWEPPQLEHGFSLAQRFEALIGANVSALTPVGQITHILSHRRLVVEVQGGTLRAANVRLFPWGGDYDRFELVPPSELSQRGLASFARKVLAAAGIG